MCLRGVLLFVTFANAWSILFKLLPQDSVMEMRQTALHAERTRRATAPLLGNLPWIARHAASPQAVVLHFSVLRTSEGPGESKISLSKKSNIVPVRAVDVM